MEITMDDQEQLNECVINDYLWDNELVTWSDDELKTEEIFIVFVNAVLEEL